MKNYLILRALALFFCFSEKSFKGLKPSKIMFYIANPDLKVGAIERTKTNRAGQLLRCFFSVALPFRAGVLKGKLSFFEGFSPFIFCFSEKSLKGLKPSKIMFYIATPDLKVGAIELTKTNRAWQYERGTS